MVHGVEIVDGIGAPSEQQITWKAWRAGGGETSLADYRAVLFDLDGTLVDTMPLHYRAYRAVLAEYGVQLEQVDFERYAPSPASTSIPNFISSSGADPRALPAVSLLHAQKKRVFGEILARDGCRPLPPAEIFDDARSAGRVVGIVTSGNRTGATQILKRQNWLNGLAVFITGDDVERGKPDPQPYNLAAAKLAVPVGSCIVFEDSPAGICSATEAGMTVVDVSSTMVKQ